MELTPKQQEGLDIAIARHRAGEKYTCISGYAGTGKSTLVRFIIEALDVEEDKVCYCAFTGKAAEVLRKKGNKNVCTLHRLLYDHIPKPAGGFFRKPKPQLDYTIVVVDEVSMAPKTLMDLLLAHKVYVICLGDPFQLPPIDKDEDNHLLDHPHVFLDEIMRQAAESEIIQLTMKIRNHETIDYMKGQEVQVINKDELNTGMLLWADQILTATNAKRLAVNNQMRSLLGRGPTPEDGDKVICLRNYWDDLSLNGDPLVNGTIGTLTNSFQTWREIPRWIRSDVHKFDILQADFVVDGDIYEATEMDRHMILTGEKCCDWRLSYQLGKLKPKYGEIVPKEFTYGYAITYWKAQGSEWDKVLMIEETFPFDRETHARAMYTAATRASKKLVWLR
jgi:exodeoxyribonuclease-5